MHIHIYTIITIYRNLKLYRNLYFYEKNINIEYAYIYKYEYATDGTPSPLELLDDARISARFCIFPIALRLTAPVSPPDSAQNENP